MKGILFLCVANSARSQMAEAIARQAAGARLRIQSAGSNPTRIHPLALRALGELGIDATSQRSKSVDEIDRNAVDLVITLCAEEVCPVYLGEARRIHWPLPDPAGGAGSEEEGLARFRAVRDELGRRIASLVENEASAEPRAEGE